MSFPTKKEEKESCWRQRNFKKKGPKKGENPKKRRM